MAGREDVTRILSATSLPADREIYSALTFEDGTFISEEGSLWDFKDSWPFSVSDDYFAGLARLICAFSNTIGGLIVFGVHDVRRTGGHNKVQINLDKFVGALQHLLNVGPLLEMRSCRSEKSGDIDVLRVWPRLQTQPPIRFKKTLGKYKAGAIWVRAGHEVREATPADFPSLFCRAGMPSSLDENSELDGSIPPSPATLRRFIGRVAVMDGVFEWLHSADEPRTFLYGKGGSGKTSIAYEFARLLRDYGANLSLPDGQLIDVVLFVTAKSRELVPATGLVRDTESTDFASEADLLRKILVLGRWASSEADVSKLDSSDLRQEVVSFFDTFSVVVVIDDVDTLTTRGVDAGIDTLFKIVCRSRRQIKILYTLRNAPTHSLQNSIEVPGLSYDGEYQEFVSECARQYSVTEPNREFRDGELAEMSERRPLVVESVIALARTAGNYRRAAQLFNQNAGDNVRDYVFMREWDALISDNLARQVLSALSEIKRPASFADLQTVLQVDPSRLSDALGAVREMFLQVGEASGEAMYSLAPLTSRFVNSKKGTLAGFNIVRERVANFKRTVTVAGPEVAAIMLRVERLVPSREASHSPDKLVEAWRIVSDNDLLPSVTESPIFRSLVGYIASVQRPPNLNEARAAFTYALEMRYEPEYRFIRAWSDAERVNLAHDGWAERIADIVISGRSYSEHEKKVMVSRKATSIYARARERMYTDTIAAQKDFVEAIGLHLRAFRLSTLEGNPRAGTSEEYARNTAFTLFDLTFKSEAPLDFVDQTLSIADCKDVFLDPLHDPLRDAISACIRRVSSSEMAHRTRNRLKLLADRLDRAERWLEAGRRTYLVELARAGEVEVAEFTKRSRPGSMVL